MNIQHIAKRLDQIQSLIESADILDDKLKSLIRFDLFENIIQGTDLNNEFEGRAHYFEQLIKDPRFLALENELIEVLSKVANLASIQDVASWSPLDASYPTYSNYLNIPNKVSISKIDIWKSIQNKNNLHMLQNGLIQKEFNSNDSNKPSFFWKTSYIKHQFEMIPKQLTINTIFLNKNKKVLSEFKILDHKFVDLFYQYIDIIENIPKRKHVNDFERFKFICNKFQKIKDYPFRHQHIFTYKLDDIKTVSINVIDALMDHIYLNIDNSDANVTYAEEKGDILLDTHILFKPDKGLLVKKVKNGVYKDFIKLSPLKRNIIHHLYQIKTYPINRKGLKELADLFSDGKNNSSISNNIKWIRETCEKYEIKQILQSTHDSKWRINHNLSCCNFIQNDSLSDSLTN